jgi:hypothetical protein
MLPFPRLALTMVVSGLLFGCASAAPRGNSPRPVAAGWQATPEVSEGQLFVADQACQSLEAVTMPSLDASPETAVLAILHSKALAELPMGETHVKVTESTALVDFRLQVGTSRTLHELSTCEQLALLGAIRHTLQANPRWGIHRVVFTDRGNLFAI